MADINAETLDADFFTAGATDSPVSQVSEFDDPFGEPVASEVPVTQDAFFDSGSSLGDFPSSEPVQSAPIEVTEQVIVQEVKSSFGGFGSPIDNGPIQKWQNEHTELLARNAANAQTKHREILDKADNDSREFIQVPAFTLTLQKRDAQTNKARQANREKEAHAAEQREKPCPPGQEWARVGDLVDFKAKSAEGKDTSRYKSILLALKH